MFLPCVSLYKNEVMGGRDVWAEEEEVVVQGASSMGTGSSFRSQIEEVEEQEGEVKNPIIVVSLVELPMGRADTDANWALPFLGVLELELGPEKDWPRKRGWPKSPLALLGPEEQGEDEEGDEQKEKEEKEEGAPVEEDNSLNGWDEGKEGRLSWMSGEVQGRGSLDMLLLLFKENEAKDRPERLLCVSGRGSIGLTPGATPAVITEEEEGATDEAGLAEVVAITRGVRMRSSRGEVIRSVAMKKGLRGDCTGELLCEEGGDETATDVRPIEPEDEVAEADDIDDVTNDAIVALLVGCEKAPEDTLSPVPSPKKLNEKEPACC